MQLKLVISLALLALCSARSIDYDYIVDVEDDHVTVQNKVGQEVHIYVKQHVGSNGHYIQIHVSGPGVVLDTHKYVNEPVSFEGQYQAEALYQIFNKFEGPLDDVSYEKLLAVIAEHVREGHVHPAVLYALQKLSPNHQSADLINPLHQDVYNTVQRLFKHVGLDQEVPYSKHGAFRDISSSGKYGKWWGVGGVHQWNKQSEFPGVHSWAHQYGSDYPEVSGYKSWSHYPGVYGSKSWAHHSGSHYPETYGVENWTHKFGSHYPGVQSWAHQYESDYPEVSDTKSWSHYPGSYGAQTWAHQTGSHYPGVWSAQHWGKQSQYPSVYGQSWAKEGYGSHYPGVYGSHQSYGGFYGPYSSDVYNTNVAHEYGLHHVSPHKQWPREDTWSNWQGVNQHQVVAY